jgi:hypothetical protein
MMEKNNERKRERVSSRVTFLQSHQRRKRKGDLIA